MAVDSVTSTAHEGTRGSLEKLGSSKLNFCVEEFVAADLAELKVRGAWAHWRNWDIEIQPNLSSSVPFVQEHGVVWLHL